jgi:uncharacterized protein (TIGR03435 family)
VATIKPGDHSYGGGGHGFPSRGRIFHAKNCTVNDLLVFAYGIQIKQIVDGPAWLDKDTFDISGEPDQPGQPSQHQWERMLQKLLADRFRLTVHQEKRNIPLFLLTLAKTGPKLTPSKDDTLAALNMRFSRNGFVLVARSQSIAELASALQDAVLDRPVVDATGLPGKFDFQITFAPGGGEFGGKEAPEPNSDSSAPSLFTAVQDLGLKLESREAPVDVMVIDHVEQPSPN